jgi:hypothetical protein
MIPIRYENNKNLEELTSEELYGKILKICKEHHAEKRALAFAFILFDFHNPQISKVLSDFKYWKALDVLSGKFLSVFHLHTNEEFFAEDLARFNGVEMRNLYRMDFESVKLERIKHFISPQSEIKIPSILFFQTDGTMVVDYYVIELREETIEASFIEIKNYIKAAVDSLKKVDSEYNKQTVFNLIEKSVKSVKIRRDFNKVVNSFPLNLFLGWLTGKV